MKPTKSVAILVIAILLLAGIMFINNKHSDSQKSQATIEATKSSFLKQLNQPGISIDSTYVIKDTLRFYSKGSYLGKSVIVKE